MQTQKFLQTMKDGTDISVNRWIPEDTDNIKGVIQLSHGMQEHSLRYDKIGCILADAGFVFSAHDHRGHGKTAQIAEQKGTGKFQKLADKHGFDKVINDLDELIDELKNDYKDKPVFLFGHSFGSFVSQGYIERHGEKLDGCILCGSSGPNMVNAKSGYAVTSILKALTGKNRKSVVMQNMFFNGYNDRFKSEKDDLAWLSKSVVNRDMYRADSWCGGTATLSFLNDITYGLKTIHKPCNMKKIPKNLPVFIIYGTDDPVGNYGKSLEKLKSIYESNGMDKVSIKGYEKDRHEILNEQDGDKVLQDVMNWLNSLLA